MSAAGFNATLLMLFSTRSRSRHCNRCCHNSNVTSATGVGFGAPASGQTHPAVFIIGTVAGQYGFYRSDDGAGASWTRINDDRNQFGSLQGNYIGGDETHFGRVFLTTGGRGYIYGDAN